MNNCSNFISLCIPCSSKYHALQDFKYLNAKKKVFVSAITALVAIVTFPIFGLLAVAAFRSMVKKISSVPTLIDVRHSRNQDVKKIQEQSRQNLPQQPEIRVISQELESELRTRRATPLIYAIVRNDIKKVEELINQEIDVNVADTEGCLPLHWAASREGNLEAVRLLVERTHIDARDNQGNTALMHARRKDVVEFLLEHHANADLSNDDDETPLSEAATFNYLEIVKLLLNKTHSNTAKSYALGQAAMNGSQNVVKFLLEQNVDANIPDNEGVLPLIRAINSNCQFEIIKLLKDKTNDINTKDELGRTPLSLGICSGQSRLVEFLLEQNFDPNIPDNDGSFPLHHAVQMHNSEYLLTRLIPLTNNINARANDGSTVLSRCAEGGSGKVVKFLLKHNADANIPDQSGNLPLHCAAYNRHLKVVNLLAPKTHDINARGYNRSTALSLAAEAGAEDIVKFLLKKNADANIADVNGDLPLHWAVRKRLLNIVELLVPKTTNINATGREGKTALGLAAEFDYPEIIKFLGKQPRIDYNILDDNGMNAATWMHNRRLRRHNFVGAGP